MNNILIPVKVNKCKIFALNLWYFIKTDKIIFFQNNVTNPDKYNRGGAISDAPQVRGGAICDALQVSSGAICDAANSRRAAIFHASKFHFLLKNKFH